MHVNNIKKFLKERINKELNLGILHRLYEELYQISKTEKDYIFLFEKLMDNNCDQHTYSSLKLLSMISIKISKELCDSNSLLQASFANSSKHIINIVWSIADNLRLAHSSLSLWEVIKTVVEFLSNLEKLL